MSGGKLFKEWQVPDKIVECVVFYNLYLTYLTSNK